MLRVWMPVALLLYLFPSMPVRFHALNDVSIPMAILAVRFMSPVLRGLAAPRRPLAAAAVVGACLLLIVPGTFDRLRSARGAVYLNLQPYHFEPGERDALNALQRAPGGGGVLTTPDMGSLVPKSTGRETWVGSPSWSPDFGLRAAGAYNLLSGRLTPDRAVALVRSTGARYVLADCRGRADLRRTLRPLLKSVAELRLRHGLRDQVTTWETGAGCGSGRASCAMLSGSGQRPRSTWSSAAR